MPDRDTDAFAFNSQDADDLINMINSPAGELPKGRVLPAECILCKTPGGGIAARSGTTISSASCDVFRQSSGTISDSGTDATVWNISSTAVAGSTYIIAAPTNVGYVAVWEDC